MYVGDLLKVYLTIEELAVVRRETPYKSMEIFYVVIATMF